MAEASPLMLVVGAWLFTYLIHTLLAIWATVAIVRLAALVRAHRALDRVAADRVPLTDETIDTRIRLWCGDTDARVSVSHRTLTPMVIGRRELCLPVRALRELSSAELDAVLAHEIAHIVRHDRLWLSLAALVERALFLQPLNALATRRMRAVAECSCDDWALRRTERPVALASALARVTEWLAGAPAERLAIGIASRESLALTRVRRILDPCVVRLTDERRPLHALLASMVLVAVILLAPGVSAGASLGAFSVERQSPRHTIQAEDDAGPFTLTLERGRAVAMTIGGEPVERSRLVQTGNRLHVADPRGGPALDLTVTARGGITWTSRPHPVSRGQSR